MIYLPTGTNIDKTQIYNLSWVNQKRTNIRDTKETLDYLERDLECAIHNQAQFIELGANKTQLKRCVQDIKALEKAIKRINNV